MARSSLVREIARVRCFSSSHVVRFRNNVELLAFCFINVAMQEPVAVQSLLDHLMAAFGIELSLDRLNDTARGSNVCADPIRSFDSIQDSIQGRFCSVAWPHPLRDIAKS